MYQILVREGANAQTSNTLYKAVVQVILFFCSETCFMTPRIVRILGVFIHRVDFRLVGMKLQRGG